MHNKCVDNLLQHTQQYQSICFNEDRLFQMNGYIPHSGFMQKPLWQKSICVGARHYEENKTWIDWFVSPGGLIQDW